MPDGGKQILSPSTRRKKRKEIREIKEKAKKRRQILAETDRESYYKEEC